MLGPLGLFVLAKVASEGLLAPLAVARVGDWREGGNGLVFAGVLEELWGIVGSGMHDLSPKEGMLTKVKAPCPPMLCPKTLTLSESTCLKLSKTALGSSEEM